MTVGATGVAAWSMACGPAAGPEPRDEPDRYAAAVCESAAKCDCLLADQDLESCIEEHRERFADMLADNPFLDAEQFEAGLADLRGGDCTPTDRMSFSRLIVTGDKPRGAACNAWAGRFSPFAILECEAGLACSTGRCLAPSDDFLYAEPGAPCSPDDVPPCLSEDPDVQLFCGADGICHEAAGVGEPCASPEGCRLEAAPGLYCAGVTATAAGTCTPRLSLGDACDPLDVFPCYESKDVGLGWCDATASQCVSAETVPLACIAATWPR